jgi:hypothetical protein
MFAHVGQPARPRCNRSDSPRGSAAVIEEHDAAGTLHVRFNLRKTTLLGLHHLITRIPGVAQR